MSLKYEPASVPQLPVGCLEMSHEYTSSTSDILLVASAAGSDSEVTPCDCLRVNRRTL